MIKAETEPRRKKAGSGFGLCVALSLVFFGMPTRAEEDYLQLRGALHVQSRFSTGKGTIAWIAREAVERGVDVLVIADTDQLRVDYGIPFLRDLVCFHREERAILNGEGLKAYLDEIRQLDAFYPDLIAIDGVESAPFYYWEVDLLRRRLILRHWDRHLLAVNLQTTEAYDSLPSMGREHVEIWHWSGLFLLWPLLGVVYGFVARGRHPAGLRIPVAVISALCLINNFPFKVPLMNAYSGDLGSAPYQFYIDQVNARGGMAFWPHPEALSPAQPESYLNGLFNIINATQAHDEDLVSTRDYTGFAALSGSRATVAEPGGEWDQVLNEYTTGQREKPVWATGERDFSGDQKGLGIDRILTVFLVREKTRAGVLDAVQKGRMYAVQGGGEQLVLNRFEVETGAGRAQAGETIEATEPVEVNVAIEKLNESEEQVHVRLIRSGEVVVEFNAVTPLEFKHVDGELAPGESAYFRLMARSRTARLVSNPVFVRGRAEQK